MPSRSGTGGAESTPPVHPIHVASRSRSTECRAVTSPPGLRRQSTVPSGSTVSSTGSRLATTTRALRAMRRPPLFRYTRDGDEWMAGRYDPFAAISTDRTLKRGNAEDKLIDDFRYLRGRDGNHGRPASRGVR